MRALYAAAALLLAGGLAGFTGREDVRAPALHQVVDNVVFDLAATPDGVTACLNTSNGAKLSGQYGIEITAVSAADAWEEKLPKKVAVAEDYFHLPLRIDLKRSAGNTGAGQIHFEAAACQAAGMCVPVEASFDIGEVGSSRSASCG